MLRNGNVPVRVDTRTLNLAIQFAAQYGQKRDLVDASPRDISPGTAYKSREKDHFQFFKNASKLSTRRALCPRPLWIRASPDGSSGVSYKYEATGAETEFEPG